MDKKKFIVKKSFGLTALTTIAIFASIRIFASCNP
jgi:hypothetical protein